MDENLTQRQEEDLERILRLMTWQERKVYLSYGRFIVFKRTHKLDKPDGCTWREYLASLVRGGFYWLHHKRLRGRAV